MKKVLNTRKCNPYWRYEEALRRVRDKACDSKDIWVRKLCAILKLRDACRKKYDKEWERVFEEKTPLFAQLLRSFEDTRVGGDRDLLEAVILASPDFKRSAELLRHPGVDSLFLGLYKQLCFDISKVAGNRSAEFQQFIIPMLKENTSKLALGSIWKVLALVGGISLLVRKGLGTDAIEASDIDYLLQLAAFRHCSEMLRYTSSGSKIFENNPAAGALMNTLTDMASLRGRGRRPDWLAELKAVVKNNMNSLLSGELKLLGSLPKDKLLALSMLDGQFAPEQDNTLEMTKHVVFNIGEEPNA